VLGLLGRERAVDHVVALVDAPVDGRNDEVARVPTGRPITFTLSIVAAGANRRTIEATAVPCP